MARQTFSEMSCLHSHMLKLKVKSTIFRQIPQELNNYYNKFGPYVEVI